MTDDEKDLDSIYIRVFSPEIQKWENKNLKELVDEGRGEDILAWFSRRVLLDEPDKLSYGGAKLLVDIMEAGGIKVFRLREKNDLEL